MAVKKNKPTSSIYIAALGASAGGLEALQKFLANLPPQTGNIAFIIAQHLSPSYKSMLAETLRNSTSLNVVEVKTTITVKEKNIYITPPNAEININKGKLYLTRPLRTGAARPSVDNLFISLAKDCKAKAIGIVLSGTGSDGAKGLKAIKEAGGLTIAQSPVSAKYNGMPLAAIETGSVDHVLAPEKIGLQLIKAIEAPNTNSSNQNANPKNTGFDEIIEILSQKTGTDFTNYKHNTLFRRITKRLSQLSIDTPGQYLSYIKNNGSELDELFYDLLIGVTGFFRDQEVFKALEKALVALLKAKEATEPVRIWIAGCATGEEAYSIAITLAQIQREKRTYHPVQIIATDINEYALNTARKGMYPKKLLQRVAPEIIRNYFTTVNSSFEINKAIRSTVLFSKHDLTNNPPFLKLDLIVCRNLLIYFNSKLQNHVFPVFHSALLPNGYLLLGKSESIGHFTSLFSTVSRPAKIFQRKASTYISKMHYVPFKPKEEFIPLQNAKKTIAEMARETIFRAFEWPYVVVNDSIEIQEIHGEVNRYLGLKPGHMNASLIKLAHKDLRTELRLLVNKSIADKKETRGLIKKIDIDGKGYFVKIIVYPLLFSEQPDDYYMVIFEEVKIVEPATGEAANEPVKKSAGRIAELEKELESVKDDLQTFVDRLENTNTDLQSTNEELQAANEELKISNEELETANEELQSANEEINIAYTELKAANEMLEIHDAALHKSEANVNALLNNTLQAFILLDETYRVLAYNNVAYRLFKNIFGKTIETGEYFPDQVSKNFNGYLKEEIEQAFTGRIVTTEKDVKTAKGKTYSFIINCTPVLDEYRKVKSLSIGLLDCTELKHARNELLRSQELLNSVFHTADIGIAVLNEKGRYVKMNDGYNRLFGYKKGELEGKPYSITVPEKNRKETVQVLKQYFAGTRDEDERVAVKKNGEQISIYRTASVLKNADGTRYLVVTGRDISDTKKYRLLLQNTEKIAHIAGWEMDVVTKKIAGTEELYNIIELEKEEFDKLPFRNKLEIIFNGGSQVMVRQLLKDAIEKRLTIDMEIPLLTATKKNKWVRITCTPEPFQISPRKLIGTLQDITNKKEAEIELERLSLVASKTNNAVVITDKYGKTIWVNESFQTMTGFTLEEIKGKTPGEVLQGTNTDKAIIKKISQRLKKHLAVSEVIKNYRKDGSFFWMNMDIAPVVKNNVLENFIAVGVDITELMEAKRAERIQESLEQQQRLFNAIAKNFPDGIIGVLDKELNYVFTGGSEIEKLHLTQQQLIGNKIFDHLSEEKNAIAETYLKQALQGENLIFEIEILDKNYAVTAVPLMGTDEDEARVLVVINNITSRLKAENELKQSLKKEKELNELKTRFVSMASHEFRTPLSTVLSSAFLIEKYTATKDQSKRQVHLRRIISSVSMLTDILNDFLSVGKIEEGKIQVRPAWLNMREVISAILNEIENNLKEGQKIEYEHEGLPDAFLDSSLLKHILMNLISNASKFSPAGSVIEVNSICYNKTVKLIVKDHGMGISTEDQQHLMERFFRGANAGNIQGTGLGLHLVAKYAELMNGVVACKSELKNGTEFLVTFNFKIN